MSIGESVDSEPCTCSPRLVNGNIPIITGGDSDAVVRKAARIADGYFPGEGDAKKLKALITKVRNAAEVVGRDPDSIEINAMFGAHMQDPKAGMEQMEELGVGRIMVPAFFFMGPNGVERMRKFAAALKY